MATAFIGVGSNIDPQRNVVRALAEIRRFARPIATSRFYTTRPIGRPDQASYANGAWLVETEIEVRELRRTLRTIEEKLGRIRSTDKYASRPIDLDILLYDELVIEEEELRIPDPHIAERAFLAAALLDIRPDLTLPGSGRPLADTARIDRRTLIVNERLTSEVERSIQHERAEG